MAQQRNDGPAERPGHSDPYRDNDDARAPIPREGRNDVKSDSRSEARGDARENVGNTARGTSAHPTGPEGNDRTRGRPVRDEFDEDLARDNAAGGVRNAAEGGDARAYQEGQHVEAAPRYEANDSGGDAARGQHARKGQAESPRELTHNEPPKKKEGHH